MSLVKTVLIIVLTAAAVIVLGWAARAGFLSFLRQPEVVQSVQSHAQTQAAAWQDFDFLRGVENPCDFRSERGLFEQPGAKKLYELKNAGYPKEITIEEAIAIFNKFAECDATGKMQPPLRNEELIAAIRDLDCQSNKELQDKKVCADFRQIAETRKMPKGALIDYSGGLGGYVTKRGYGGFNVKTWEIRLNLRLDKYRNDLKDVPQFEHLIRLTYISSEADKSSNNKL